MSASKITGLSNAEAVHLREKFGDNALPEGKRKSRFDHFVAQFSSPLIYILVIAGVITYILEDYKDSIVIMSAVLVNTFLGYYQESKAEEALQALKNMLAPTVKVLRGGERIKMPAKDLVPGDIVYLAQGEKVPADGTLIQAVHLSANESILTGESQAVHKNPHDELFMGTIVLSGHGVMRVDLTGKKTKMGGIAQKISLIDDSETPLQTRLKKLAKNLAIVVLTLSATVLGIGITKGLPFTEIFSTSVALAVAAIPEGMAVSLTVILAIGMQRILKRKALVRRLVAAETLGSVTVIATDKTGTLTEGLMKVVKTDLTNEKRALEIATYANNVEDPLEIALWDWVQSYKMDPQDMSDSVVRVDEEPFDSNKKYMSVTIKDTMYIKGAPEVLLDMTSLPAVKKKKILKQTIEWSEEGLRIIALAYKSAGKMHWVGLVGLQDPVRKDLPKIMKKTHSAGIRTIMVTGDYAGTARSVWANVMSHSIEPYVLDGKHVESLSDKQLVDEVQKAHIYARVTPEQKLRVVNALQENGEIVALLGDGVNDAPALKSANIGIVVGTASDVAKETADMVLLDSNFNTVIAAIEEGRVIFDNMRKVILYLLSDAFAEIILVIGCLFLGLPIPLTAAQILWINVITDGLPAIALTFEPKDKNILKRKPIDQRRALVDGEMKMLIGIISGFTGIFSLVIFIYFYQTSTLDIARTVTFASLAVGTLVYIFSVRSLTQPMIGHAMPRNYFLYFAILVGLFFQIGSIHIDGIRMFLNNAELESEHWVVAGVFTIILIVVIELTKYVFNKVRT